MQSVNANFVNGPTIQGLVSFANVTITNPNEDYYFIEDAPSYTSAASVVFDVLEARMRLETVLPSIVSTASRMQMQAVVRRGTGAAGPIDTLADGISVRLSLFSCLGFPAPCSAELLNSNVANLVMSNGTATFTGLFVDVAGEDRYFVPATPGISGISFFGSSVFDVVQATIRVASPLSFFYTGQTYPLDAVIRRGSAIADPIDTLAHGIGIRLRLLECLGFPAPCSPSELIANFANTTAVNGIASFNNLVFATPGEDRYFVPIAPVATGLVGAPSTVFDVLLNPFIFANGFESP